ncbi:pyrroloquinoline quinone biosynthesis protein PqqB [Microvirga makkahensis]|uniref:Coenzyme PQQ synthesis protein B n=1 Tax=Microvirga makkahensis TaxID=1128670 RepID=A0A7X3MRT9_9HYPH|nr:pyrroloquinoline quinone biosynthesis protein PqqB [Microvirga makkahensis]
MQAVILGSAAGGGVPQWNCRCPVCQLAWAGDPRVKAGTQSSLAVSPDGERWLVLNASPDIRHQISQTGDLHPRMGLRHSPIDAVLLTSAEVDHVAGLLTMRERQPFAVFATPQILDTLALNPIFDVLAPQLVTRHAVDFEQSFEPVGGLLATIFAVPGKVPLWRENQEGISDDSSGTTVGVILESSAKRIAYIPGCAWIDDDLLRRIAGVDALLFDGTVFRDDELIQAGVSEKTGRRMGHVPMSGQDGSLVRLRDVPASRRVFVHINNTNPVLVQDSPERRLVEQQGWIVAHDGLRIFP